MGCPATWYAKPMATAKIPAAAAIVFHGRSRNTDQLSSGIIGSPMADLTDKPLITENDVRDSSIGAALRIDENALVTPLAADPDRKRHITLERATAAAPYRRRQPRRI